jgi:hypothetical protein
MFMPAIGHCADAKTKISIDSISSIKDNIYFHDRKEIKKIIKTLIKQNKERGISGLIELAAKCFDEKKTRNGNKKYTLALAWWSLAYADIINEETKDKLYYKDNFEDISNGFVAIGGALGLKDGGSENESENQYLRLIHYAVDYLNDFVGRGVHEW